VAAVVPQADPGAPQAATGAYWPAGR
jgi:hypothetical protein